MTRAVLISLLMVLPTLADENPQESAWDLEQLKSVDRECANLSWKLKRLQAL